MTKSKPNIKVTKLTEPFWSAVKERKFLLQYDPSADRYQFYPRPLSLHSEDGVLEWREASGLGTLVACSMCHAPGPGFEGEVPYLLGLVALDEGPRVFAQVARTEEAAPAIGSRMRIAWKEQDSGQVVYEFAPA